MTKAEKKLLEEHTKAMRDLAAAIVLMPRWIYTYPYSPPPVYPLPYIPSYPPYIVTTTGGTIGTTTVSSGDAANAPSTTWYYSAN